MNTDALNRRKRTDVQPTGKNPQLNAGVLALLEGLRRYHPLPPRLAFGFYEGMTYYNRFQKKLTDLTHERPDGEAPVVERNEYFNPKGVLNSEPVWYELSERGQRIADGLADTSLSLPERDHIKHRAFNACVGASFELLAPEHGIDIIRFEQMLQNERCPAATRKLPNPLRLPLAKTRHLEPDRLMGFNHVGKGFRFYAIEVDRATETNARTVYEKLDHYIEALSRGLYQSFWGLPNLRILFITTAPGRIDTLIKYLEGKPHAQSFYFKALPDFGIHWKAPRQALTELFEPWRTVEGMKDISRA